MLPKLYCGYLPLLDAYISNVHNSSGKRQSLTLDIRIKLLGLNEIIEKY